MALRRLPSLAWSRLGRAPVAPRPMEPWHPGANGCRYSSEATAPPLLQKLKADLKIAMRAKDDARLTVLRSILSSTANAAKTDQPIATDAHLISLLRKSQKLSEAALADFKTAGREDLVEKEQAQINVLQEYVAGRIDQLSEEDMRAIANGVVDEVVAAKASNGEDRQKVEMKDVAPTLNSPSGPLEGKILDKATKTKLFNMVKSVIEAKKA